MNHDLFMKVCSYKRRPREIRRLVFSAKSALQYILISVAVLNDNVILDKYIRY
jgi:hypothetical protein